MCIRDRLNGIHIKALANAGVELITGWGQFVDAHTVQVGDQQFTARQIMVAVGGRPQRLTIPGGELGWVSDDLFLQQDLPSSILIIGAGYIACEFACILQGLGVAVTQVIRGDRILKGFDQELSDSVREGMEELGVTLRFGLQPTAIEQTQSAMVLRCGCLLYTSPSPRDRG